MPDYWITTHWPIPKNQPFSRHVFVKDRYATVPARGAIVFIREAKEAEIDGRRVTTCNRHHRGEIIKGFEVPLGTGGIVGIATADGPLRDQQPDDILYDFGDLPDWYVVPCTGFERATLSLDALRKLIEMQSVRALNLYHIRNESIGTRLLDQLSPRYSAALTYPDEVTHPELYPAGVLKTVTVNRYERNAAARRKCVEHYGAKCQACGLLFPERYDGLGDGFMHVHHLTPVSQLSEGYQLDPIADLRPVCPNCHAMLHTQDPPLTIEELKQRLGDRHA